MSVATVLLYDAKLRGPACTFGVRANEAAVRKSRSPAVTSIAPAVVTLFGGQQSARTLHLFAAIAIFTFSTIAAV